MIIRATGLSPGPSSAASQDSLGHWSHSRSGAGALAGVKECDLPNHTFQIFVLHRWTHREEICDFDGNLTKSFRGIPLRPLGGVDGTRPGAVAPVERHARGFPAGLYA